MLEVCRSLGVPLTARGAGTSIAGNAVGPGVVVDTSRHLDRVLAIDAEARTATVEPGLVQAALQTAARPHGLRFGPDPSTHNRCTIGGMIGNNACGSRALGYGRTSDNVVGLDVVTGAGQRLRLDGTAAGRHPRRPAPPGRAASSPRSAPSSAASAARCRATRWSTCCPSAASTSRGRWSAARARSRWCSAPRSGWWPTRRTAGWSCSATPRWPTPPTRRPGCSRTVRPPSRAWTPASSSGCATCPPPTVPDLPRGEGWLIVELTGDTVAEVTATARGVLADSGALDSLVVTDVAEAAAIWRIREDGAGLAARTSDGNPAHAGWEDAAVPVERLGAYLREFEALLAEHGLQGVPYGHFGDGCVHVRIDFPFGAGSRGRRPGRLPLLRRGRRPAGRRATAARCRASTATAARAASCCR